MAEGGMSWRAVLVRMAYCHAWPVVFFIAFYVVSLRGMDIGGGDMPSIPAVIAKA